MKKTVSLFCALCALCGLTACSTTQVITNKPDGSSVTNSVNHLDPQRTAAAVRAIIPPAVILAVAKEPAAREPLHDAQIAVCFISSLGNVTPEQLKASIEATRISQIQTPEAQAAISAVYGIYQAYYGDLLAQKLSGNEIAQWALPVLQAICDGLNEGLAAATPAPTPTPNFTVAPAVLLNSTPEN